MRDTDNPYRSPDARIADTVPAAGADEETCWRHGRTLVVLRERPLPRRCVRCNADAHDGMRVRTFSWVSHWSYSPLLALLLVPFLADVVPSPWLVAVVPLAFIVSLMANLSCAEKPPMRWDCARTTGGCAAGWHGSPSLFSSPDSWFRS